MEWVKGIIGMNCFWLISNCFCSSVFAFLFFGISLLLLSYCFPVPFSIPLIFVTTCVLNFAAFLFFMNFPFIVIVMLFVFLYFLFEVMLSCGIAIFLSSPTNNTFAKTVLIIFNIFTFFLFGLLSVLAWVFFNKNYFTVFNTELIKRFHRVRIVFWGIFILDFYYLDKIYNLFYVLPFFDLVFQLLNRCSIYFNQHQLSYKFVRFHICSHLCLSIYLKSSFR